MAVEFLSTSATKRQNHQYDDGSYLQRLQNHYLTSQKKQYVFFCQPVPKKKKKKIKLSPLIGTRCTSRKMVLRWDCPLV